MPMKPQKPCKHPGCPNLTDKRYCEIHSEERASAHKRGYDNNWRKARNRFLKHNPLCVRCKEEGKVTAAKVVDHIKPHRGDKTLFWDRSNWQSLCERCHNRKTRTEDQYQEYRY